MSTHFITIAATSDEDLASIYRLSVAKLEGTPLRERDVALVFEHPSLRTRAASATAVYDLGGRATFFSDDEIGLDTRESAEDVARTLAETFSVCALRARHHGVFERMRRASGDRLALVNLLSDAAHPTQAVADVLTIAECLSGGDPHALEGVRIGYVGDATNVTRSLAVALIRLGALVTVAAPAGYQLLAGGDEDPLDLAGPGRLTLVEDPRRAAEKADVLYTDAWVSMGLEAEAHERRRVLAPYRLDEALVELASSRAIVLHCLPAHRGEEISDGVLDGARSRVWRQVFHRRSAMRGVLRWMEGER